MQVSHILRRERVGGISSKFFEATALGVAFFAFLIGAMTLPQTWRPYIGYGFDPTTGKVLTVDPHSPAAAAGVQVGDVLTYIDGVPLAQARPLYRHQRVGARVRYTFLRNEQVLPIDVTWAPAPWIELTNRVMHFTLSLTFWLLGIAGWYLRIWWRLPNNARERTASQKLTVIPPKALDHQIGNAFLLLCSWAAVALWLMPLTANRVEWAIQLIYIAHLFAGIAFLHFHILFPAPKSDGRWQAALNGGYFVAFFASLVIAIYPPSRLEQLATTVKATYIFSNAISLFFVTTIILGLVALVSSYRGGGGDARRKIRLVVGGTLIGMIPLLIYYIAGLDHAVPYELAIATLIFIPIAYTVSISHLDMMGVDYTLYRILVGFIVALSVMTTFLALVAILNKTLGPQLVQAPLANAALCYLVAKGFVPIQRSVDKPLGWLFHGWDRDYSEVKVEAIRSLASHPDRDTLVNMMTAFIPSAMNVRTSALLVLAENSTLRWVGGALELDGTEGAIRLDQLDSGLLSRLHKGDLVATNGDNGPFSGPTRWWIPLRLADELQGVWVIGSKANDESFSPSDRKLMSELAAHGAFVVKVLETVDQLNRQRDRAEEYAQQVLETVGQLNRQRERAESYSQELQQAYTMLFKAQDEERGRFSRDLHDDVLQRLYILDMETDKIRAKVHKVDAETASLLGKQQEELGEIMQIARDVCYGLRSSALQAIGLPGALNRLVHEAAERTGTEIFIEIRPPSIRFKEEVEVTLYYVAQEALNNIIKHANAANAELYLDATGDAITLFIQDDGKGFDLAQVEGKRMGLVNIQQRVDVFGGMLSIETAPGHGTAISVEIPLMGRLKEQVTT